jgi:hypothetical protein
MGTPLFFAYFGVSPSGEAITNGYHEEIILANF